MPYCDIDVACIEQSTVGQHSNVNWHSLRKQLVTASNFKWVVSRTETILANPNESCSALLNDLVSNARDLENVPPVDWGQKKESSARMPYTGIERKNHVHLTVQTTGLFVSTENPFLGCSLDGIASCRCRVKHQDRLVEIKCPYSKRLVTPKEASADCAVRNDDGKWIIDKNHKYYAQIQGQCGIVGLKTCELVIFTTKGIHVVTVPFDVDYFQYMSRVLRCFVTQLYIPRVVADSGIVG